MWNDDDRKWLYEQMRKNGVNTGSYDDFSKSLDNKEDRDWYYQKSRSLGLNVGSADDFASMMVQPVQKSAQAPAPAQPVVKQTTGQVNPTVNTSTQPKQEEQPQKQGGWQPTWQEKMGMQMQLDETLRQVKQSQQDFNARMENIRKGNTLGKTSERKYNPETGKFEQRYYTTHGDEVTTPLEQSRLNLKYRDEWEATTEEGRRHREKRIQNDFERRVGASIDKYDPDNAAAMVWQQAEDKSNEEFGRYLDERSKPSLSNFIRGAADGMNVTGGLGADNVDTGIKAFATHLKYHDLQRMADDAWNMLGKEKQQSIIEDMYGALKNRYPQATEQQLQQAATEMAREQSDRRMYELAVAKNAPKDAAEYFIRKVAAGNAMGTLMQAAARAQAGTTGDWEAREDTEQRFEKQGHKVAGIAGTVTGFALDPLTWASAGAGGAAVKGTTWLGGKMIGEAAMRKFGTTLGGRMLGGAIGGAVNFGTYEAGSEALDQMKWGGYIDEETGERKDGFSFGNVAGRAGHGLMMGAVTGVIAPYLGNVSDKLVRATESTVGKMGIRTGELGVGTVAEGTIFAVPEIIDTYGQYGDLINSLSDESSPNYIADEQERAAKIEELRNSRGDALMDVWTDNMAMMAGFKAQHLLKSAPRVIGELAASKNGKSGFETRLRQVLDGRPDLALTEDEKKELELRGYGDLKGLTGEYSRYVEAKEEYDKARPTTTDASRMIEGGDGQAELPYNRFVELMTDNSVSEAARAKMYYYLTGHGLPMSTVMGSSILEDKDADGNVTGYTVQSFGANGVITSRSFGDKKRADVEANRINRQAELNGFDVGERYYDWQGDNKRMYEACESVAEETGAPANLLFDLMKRKTEAMNEVELEWAEKILNAYNGLGDKYGSSEVRAAINDEFGIDVDKAIRKERNRRSEQEQKAVDEYANRLFADVKRRQEEAAERGEAPVDPDAPTSNSQIAALLGIDDGEQGDPVSAAFNRGHEADAQERQDIAIELADPNNTEAQEAWNGVVQRINEDAAYMVAQQREQTKQMQHTDGSLRPAILKEKDSEGNDQQVYIVDGNVQMMPDGTMVDPEASDKSVVIFDPATGERKMIDPTADTGIWTLGEVTTAEQREADIERSRQEYVQSQIDEAQGTVRFVPGQQLVLPTGEEAVVVATDADGENITVALGDGTQATVQRSELQRIKDEKAMADYRLRHGIVDEPAAGQPEASMPAQPQADGRVAGAPADYTADMELTIRDEDGSEKPAMVMGRVRYENGSFVPDANGNIIEYFMDGEVKHDNEDKLIDKVVSHVAPRQSEAETAPAQEAEPQLPQNDEERVIREGIAGVGEGLRDAVNEQAAGVRENDINNWLQKPTVAEAMRQYGEGAQSVEEVVERALADNPTEETKAALNDIARFDSSKQIVQGYISQPQPTQPEAPVQAAEQPAAEPMPVREDGEEDWQATTPERAHAYIFNEAGLSRSEGNEFIAAQTQAAQTALVKAKSAQMPRVGTSIKKYNEAKAKRQEKIDEAQRVLDYWNGVREIQNAIQREENERRAAEDAVRHDEAVAEAQAEYEARKQAEAERKAVGNENPMPAITGKWNNATKVDGHRDEIMLPDGTALKGHYVLHESGASSPSHNPETWQKTDGFPMDANDNSVNDRDYERDHDAQEHTQSIARQYDQRALQSVPVVSNDGVVLSGNGRTMAGELAARDNTDGAYVNYLKEYAPKFGFTPGQVESMQHPRVSFVPDDAMPYTAETFARFNQQEMKSQNKTEQAVKLGKTVSDDSFKSIVRSINGYDTLGDFYNDPQASLGAVYDLHNAGVVPQAQLAEMVDGVRGQEKLSAVGREFLENMLIGKAFGGDPDVVRMLTAEPSMRQTVITALGEIADNIALGDEWSLQNELADAVRLCFDARQNGAKYGEIVSTYARQGVLFADPDELQTVADFNNATMLMLSDVLNDKRVTLLKTTLQLYNNDARQSAGGQADIFAGGIKSRGDILRGVINYINENYGKRKELEAARSAAVERRKSGSVQEDGAAPAVGGEGGSEQRLADSGRDAEQDKGLSEDEADDLILLSAERAIPIPEMELTHENWVNEFGNGVLITPLGEIKLGENQFSKMIDKGREKEAGMIKPTLTDPDFVIEEASMATEGETERPASHLYVKSFIGIDGRKRYFFKSVTVKKDGMEVNVSNHFDRVKRLREALKNGKLLYRFDGGAQTEQSPATASVTTSRVEPGTSEGKVSENSATGQGKAGKSVENNGVEPFSSNMESASADVNTSPTEAQKEAGNYRKGHLKFDGYDISIENPKGSVRRGTDADGNEWEQEMQNTYGYIRGTEGVDGDHIDVFLSDDPTSGDVFVVDQVNKDGSFDEHKVMYGFPDIESARKAYLSNYEEGWQGLGAITPVSKEEFKKWIESSHRKTKPFAEYSGVKPLGDTLFGEKVVAEPQESAQAYTIEPAEYTNKKGKTTPMHLVRFSGELTKEQVMAGKELVREPLPGSRSSRGWWDAKRGGFMVRSEEAARELSEALTNDEAVQDAQPMSVEDLSAVNGHAAVQDAGEARLSGHAGKVKDEPQTEANETANEEPKQEEKKSGSKWVDDADAERFEQLRQRLKKKLGGQLNMGVDPEVFAIGVEMSYYMLKHGARKFGEFARQMIDALGENVRPYLKSFYNGARDLPEMADYEKELTPYGEVRTFDVMNFDKEGAKDIIATAEHITREQEAGKQAEQAREQLKSQRNEQRKEAEQEVAANTATIRDEAEAVASETESKLASARSEREVNDLAKDIDDAIDKVNDQLAVLGHHEAENEAKTKESQSKEKKSRKKAVTSQGQTMADLFSGLLSEDTTRPTSDEQEVHLQPRTGASGREGGHQREQDEPLGASQQHEDERADASRVAGRSGGNTMSDTAGSPRVSEPSDGKQPLRPAKKEFAPIKESERRNTHNNHSERGTDYAPKSTSARIEANIKAIETMQRLTESGEPATPGDMAVLRKFSGWGGLGEAFREKAGRGDKDYNPRLRDDYQPANPINARLRGLLSPEAYEAANMSRNSAYYTPAPVIDAMWDVARAMGFRGGSVLEGSAGIGNIIGLMPADMSERSNIHAVEIDETTGNILSLLYPDANVEVKGFEKTHVPNGSVDLAITNVPFVTGLRVLDETGDKDLSRKFHDIHDFCIAKNVRKLKEGGVGIFITSSGTLDSPNSAKLRTWLVNEGGADVVGAFRMHNQTFGGTGATSDIIVIRKRVNGQKSANAIDVGGTLPLRTVRYNTGETKRGSSEVIIKDLALDVNKHFVEHPEDMAGEMAFAFEKGDTYRATSKALYPSPGINQEQRLSEWARQFKDMDWDKAGERETQQVVYEDLGEDVKEGSMLLDGDGNLCLAQRGKAVPINVNANKVKGHTKAECFNAYKAIKDALADVLEYQTTHSDDSGLQQRLAKLNKAYDAFVKTYGHLNKNTSISFLRSDMDYPSIAALESVSETGDKSGKRIVTYGKTDIFSRRVVETESEPKPATIKDGIIASIYLNGRVDVPYIAGQLGKNESEVCEEIVKSGLGFENPTTTEMEVSYEYLSGNVREKLRQAHGNNTDGRYDGNIKALERVIPMNIPAHLIEFTLGSSWVEPKLYEDFVKERTGIEVKLTNAGGTWIMSEPYWTDNEQNRAMGVYSEKCEKRILGHELIKAAITCKSISVTKTQTVGYGSSKTTETIVDKEATVACANKIDEIRQDFKDWARGKMQGDPEMSERMERVYNDLFNNSVPKEIPDEFVPEHFGGAATVVDGNPFQLRPHQAKAVVRATTQPLMLAHEVGTGKTYTLISAAMEMRRLGTARKPMIVVQNATVGQFVASAKALYPNAKILTLEDADRNAEGRRNFYAKIRYNDWDMIVVPQSVFERIPDSEERQIRFVEDKVEEKMTVLEKMREAASDDRDPVLRQAQRELDKLNDELNDLKLALQERKSGGKAEKDEKREAKTRQNAMVKAQEMLDRETDDACNFDDMGIDALLIDEAHEYKHLGFATAMQRGVKGVDPSYSKKSQGVYLKTQAVLENKNGKNVVFATGTPISNTAAEIWTFMRYLMPADTMREYGIYYFDDFVRNFGNIQQMLEFSTNGKYKENNRFAGYVNLPELVRIWSGVADTVLTREAGGVSDKIPEMEGGKARDIYLPQTKALRGVMKFVKDQLDDYENMSGKEKKENSHIPLVMYGIAKAAAVDARLVLEDAADEPNSKTNEAVRQTLRSLEGSKDYNGTVAIFADNYQNKSTGFNLYEDIRKKLIDAGVPEAQVVVMKSGMSIKKKLEIFDRVNRGEVRVIMGSTFTLGTGVNIQERLHTLIHVDAPNRPMDYTQRNGRILRQGNLHNEWGIPVRVLRFGVEDSLDVTAYQRLKTKGAIADSIMEGKKMMSNSMENRVLEEEQDLFGDITAQLSGSQYALLKNQVEKEVRKLEARRKQWEADQTYVHNQKPRLKALIKDSEERAKRNKEALAKVEAAKNDGITIGKMKFPSLDAIGDYIKDYNSKQREQQEQVRTASGYQAEAKSDLTVSVGGFDFHIHRVISKEQKQEKGQLSLSFFSKTQMTYSCPELGLEDVPVDGQRLKSALEDIVSNAMTGNDFREKAEYAERAAERYKGELQQVEARDGKPFEYADELKQAKDKLAEYEELMKAEMAEKEAKYAEMDASVEAAKGVQLSDEEDGEITKDGDMYRDGEYDDDIEQDSTMQEDRDMMRSAVQQMGEKLHTDINIIEDVNEITHPNAAVQERRRKSKGWYDTATGQVNIVLDNNKNIDDVKASVGHETIAHKGLRELVGEENYDEFLDETYTHLRDDLKKGVDAAAGRAFVDDATKNGKRAKSYEQHRRTAVDELFGRMAEKPFEEFSEGERTLWQKIKATVRRLLDKFLGSLKLPKWFELGDNELRYILWRSKEHLERGKEHPIDLARDIVKRKELGLTDEARYNMGDAPETFKARQRRAAENKGTVMPGLNDALVKVVGVPRHPYKGSWFEAVEAAVNDAIEKYTRPGKDNDGKEIRVPIPQHYDNFGAEFDYGISRKSIEESVNEEQIKKSLDGEASRGVHLAVLNHLDEVIGESIEIEEHPDYIKKDGKRKPENGTNENILVHRFVGAIKVDGKEYRVKTTMLEYKQADMASREYAYDVTKIEVLDDTTPNTPDDLDRAAKGLLPLAKVIKKLEKSYDGGKKILDESKKVDESTDLYRDPDETEDIWNDQSLGLQERITAAATRLANNHRDNKTLRNDAMRAIGGNLSDLRKAMSLQRTFDMTTVKRVADLARVLMNNGYLNGLTQQEVKRLLAAVKNSAGHNDIEGDVQKVMDIMVDNQLKHAENTLHELEAIRGSKVDARGVEVQGQLDPAGAQTMKVFKKTRGWEKTDIEKAIADAQQRMGSSDVAVADEAALEYTGLQLTLEYAENIKDSKVEERKLRDEIKQAHDDTSERDRATDGYRQYIASLHEAIRQNKIERAQAYFDLVGRLSDSLRESIANAKDFKEAEKQRIRDIQHNANSDMEGRPSDEHYKPSFADKFVNNSFVSFLFAPLATFDQMLRMFGGKSANGEGYLYNRFVRGWVDARQKEIKGVREKYSILDAKAAELFGGKVKTWGDLIRRVGKLPKGTVSFWNGGEMQERELTQGNLMYIYMVNKMLDGRMKLRKMGITEENVADIEEVLDPRLVELADWLQGEFLVETRNEYNETHKRMFGASMAAIEHYFPLKILANARADKPEDLDNPDKSDGISTATGSIIKRRRNSLALDITGADALHVILDHVAQMEHWNAYAEFNRDLNTLRTYRRFRNQVQNMTTIYGSGKELWKKFNDVCQMAAGTYRPPRAKLDEAAVNFAKGVTAAKVSFRMFTALKQFLSMPAYIPEARTDYLLMNIANPVGAWKWSMEHLPIFSERWHSRMSGDPRLLKSDMDWKMWRTRIMQLASRAGMSPNAFVDALTVSIGAHSMYQTRLAQYLHDGYSQEDAGKKAVQDAEVLYNQTQQSSEGAFTSTMQVDRSWMSVLFTVFRNASMSYQRQLHDAVRNLKRNLTPGGRSRSIEFMTKQLLRDKGIEPQTDGNWSDADWQREEQIAKRKFRRQLLKDTLRVATFGYIMQLAWNLGAYLFYLLFGDDEDEKQKMWDDVWAHTAFGSVEGLTGGDLMSQAGQMMLTGEGNPAYLSKDMPLTSDIMNALQKLGNGKKMEAMTDIVNLIVQSGIGVNPQSITDAALAIMDACGDDPALAHEATICISRILQVPQSQIDKMYFDEVGLSGDEVSKYTPAQLAERYAEFKVKRGRFFSPWSWDDEERIGKFTDKANKTIKERTEQMGDKNVNEAYLRYEEVYKGVDAKVKEAKKMAKTDYVEAAQLMADAQSDPNAFATYQMFKQMDGGFSKIVKFYLGAKTPDEAALCRQAVLDYKSAMVKVLEAPDASTRADAMNSLGTVMQGFTQKYVPMQRPNR